jgi:NTP pyrophosphatase (non-canonical NTP hydrolase)
MDFNEYQQFSRETRITSEEFPDFVTPDMVRAVSGLTGESGEVSEKLKKAIREEEEEYIEELKDEVSDCLWYLSWICDELDCTLEEVAQQNKEKLTDRQDRGVIQGSGDNR